MTWTQAKDVCVARITPNWVAWTLFTFVVGLVGASGAILCGVGIVVTMPIAALALAYAYERSVSGAGRGHALRRGLRRPVRRCPNGRRACPRSGRRSGRRPAAA